MMNIPLLSVTRQGSEGTCFMRYRESAKSIVDKSRLYI